MEFGIVALEARLEDADLSYPASPADVTAALDEDTIPYGPGGGTVRVERVLERTDRAEFRSRDDLLEATHPVFEDLRANGTGVVGWLKSLL